MSLDLILYIDKSKTPRQNPIFSQGSGVTDSGKLMFVAGDNISVGITFVDGNSVDMASLTGSHLILSVGEYAGSSPYYTQETWGISGSWGYTSSFSFAGSLTGSLGTSDKITPALQLSVTQSNGLRRTPMLQEITVLNPVDL